jgi:hypothetical protein
LATLLAALTGVLLLLATAALALSTTTLLLIALPGLLVLLVVAAALTTLVWLTLVGICHSRNSVLAFGTIPEGQQERA